MSEKKPKAVRLPNKLEALLPIIVLLTLMILNYALGWGQDPHVPVLLAAVTAMFVGKACGQKLKDMLWAGVRTLTFQFCLQL